MRYGPGNFLVWGLMLSASVGLAKELVVEPGQQGEPVLAKAVHGAVDGDVVRVRKGVYREVVVVEKRVAIVGEAGAVIDPSEPFLAEWQPAPELGKGVYQAAVERKPRGLLLDSRYVAEIDEESAGGTGPWSWKVLLGKGPPRSGFNFIRAVWMYRRAARKVYLHLAGQANPGSLSWRVIWTGDGTITFRTATGASVTGLTVAEGYMGVVLTDGARECRVSKCVIGPWEKTGVLLTGGASACVVEGNEIFRGAYEDWAPGDDARDRYEIWEVHKIAGKQDRQGVNLFRAGADNRIVRNHVYETFDGIDLGEFTFATLNRPLARPEDGTGTEMAYNVIERTRDSGIELGVGSIDVRVHHNVLRQTHGGLRFKVPRIGPLFIYRNVLEGGASFNIWYSMDDSPAEGYVYHNTIVGGRTAVEYGGFNDVHGIGAPKWHYVNNLAATRNGFFNRRGVSTPVNFIADYNVVQGGGKPWPNDPQRDRHSRYVERVELAPDLHPAPSSPAIDAGLDLSTYYSGKPLPGCEGSHFKGKAPDAGAFEVR
jgi:hypothetical protein